ncbi:head maturation protease, ClpP-related [Roseisalinus antarcticus]|uniref:ATP-dependent Clp protease proteolytic subunit n=1 Tax=Roseisalinus antarcticus TaxID=254357 RepID=A0A1Y5U5C5_9RHOB|nr:head maturation protease, ClpP-related [Roseisalinus antarcticus]SLN77313.1 ATP-dependent Clp protease proteolytic subunit [Roseisalinus antarcticus]
MFDAVAIYNALKRHAGTVTVWIDGIAASAASYIAMAGDEIVMPENAFLMIHDPSGMVMGTAGDMRDMAGTLDKIAGSMLRGYAVRSGRSEEEIAPLMAAETWFDAAEALDAGLATRLAEPVRIAASFDIARFRNAPSALVQAVQAVDTPAAADIVGDGNDVAPGADPALPAELTEPDADPAPPDPDAPREPDTPDGTVAAANTAPDPAAIRAEAIDHARAVIDLCRLAGQPQMAGRFLEEDASLDQVRAKLLAAKAEAEPQITSHHPQPGRTTTARPWSEIVARTFKLKG